MHVTCTPLSPAALVISDEIEKHLISSFFPTVWKHQSRF